MNYVKKTPGFNQITLTLTERCNQRCSYCYVPVERGRTMPFEVAVRAVDLLFASADPSKKVTVSFFGGEPFLEPDLMRRVCEAALERASRDQAVEFVATTNGTGVSPQGLSLIRDVDMRVAVSHDGRNGGDRRLAGGGDARNFLRRKLDRWIGRNGTRPLARMTVTSDNVSHLADNVRSVFSEGFKRIVYLPVYEADWNAGALKEWGDQHSRLATWMVGLAGAGRPGPDLPALKGIMSRLRGEPRRGCGAGVTQVAVGTDGRIYPCYRSVYDPRGDRLVLGDVFTGLARNETQAAMAALDPDAVRPEGRSCEGCRAQDGCGFFCPALGHLMLQKLEAIPRSACLLTEIQVEMCRRLLGVQASGRPVRRRRRWAAAAAAAAIIGGSVLGCGGRTTGGVRVDGATGDGGTGDGTIGPGVCPVLVDSGVDAAEATDGNIGPGICPVVIDSGVGEEAGIVPGVCPFVIDAGEDSGPFPGIC